MRVLKEARAFYVVFWATQSKKSAFSYAFRVFTCLHFFFLAKEQTRRETSQKKRKRKMQGARQSDVFFGERESGQDVRTSNATAVQAVANIVKSSLGPVGLDKVRAFFFFI